MKHIEQDRLVAKDANKSPVEAGIKLKCVDDSAGGDTDESWDIKLGEVYIVDYVHDEDGLLSPMVVLVGSDSGPVFPERFVVVN